MALSTRKIVSSAALLQRHNRCVPQVQPQQKRLEDELSLEQLEMCQILHSLWWKARQRNAARLQAEALRDGERSA